MIYNISLKWIFNNNNIGVQQRMQMFLNLQLLKMVDIEYG